MSMQREEDASQALTVRGRLLFCLGRLFRIGFGQLLLSQTAVPSEAGRLAADGALLQPFGQRILRTLGLGVRALLCAPGRLDGRVCRGEIDLQRRDRHRAASRDRDIRGG